MCASDADNRAGVSPQKSPPAIAQALEAENDSQPVHAQLDSVNLHKEGRRETKMGTMAAARDKCSASNEPDQPDRAGNLAPQI